MKSTSTRRLFVYWNERRGSRVAPERGDLEPGAIRSLLADSFILNFDPAAGHPLRLAGTRVCALFCREIKDAPFSELWSADSRPLIRELISVVADEAAPVVAGVSGQPAEDYPLADLELLLLPLYHHGRRNVRMLGMLAPVIVPYWLGTSPIDRLSLGAVRHLGPEAATVSAPRLVPAQGAVRLRRGFTVFDGGRP
jgi:hypothetical protein